jgi:RHS repeat-associated protein
LENRFKFNDGTEINNDFDLSIYETPFRGYDPHIGRFWQIDEMAEDFADISPFAFSANNPVLLNDPLGLAPDTTSTLEPVTVFGKKPVKHIDAGDNLIETGAGIDLRKNYNYSPGSPDPQYFLRFVRDMNPPSGPPLTVGEHMGNLLLVLPVGTLFKGAGGLFASIKLLRLNRIATILSRVSSQRIAHIMASKHGWARIVANPNWEKVSPLIGQALHQGMELPYKSAAGSKILRVGKEFVQVVYHRTTEGAYNVVDAWIVSDPNIKAQAVKFLGVF